MENESTTRTTQVECVPARLLFEARELCSERMLRPLGIVGNDRAEGADPRGEACVLRSDVLDCTEVAVLLHVHIVSVFLGSFALGRRAKVSLQLWSKMQRSTSSQLG